MTLHQVILAWPHLSRLKLKQRVTGALYSSSAHDGSQNCSQLCVAERHSVSSNFLLLVLCYNLNRIPFSVLTAR